MSPCRPDYIFTLSRGAVRFGPLGPTPFRDSRCTLPIDLYIVSQSPHERSEEHTSELQSLMRISYAVFCLKKKNRINNITQNHIQHIREITQYQNHNTQRIKYTSLGQ